MTKQEFESRISKPIVCGYAFRYIHSDGSTWYHHKGWSTRSGMFPALLMTSELYKRKGNARRFAMQYQKDNPGLTVKAIIRVMFDYDIQKRYFVVDEYI